MSNLEATWGATGLLLEGPAASGVPTNAAPTIVASINFAPPAAIPRLREFPFGPLPEASALLFCLIVIDGQPRSQAKRVVQKALGQLKSRGVEEAYALARAGDASADPSTCHFFTVEPLAMSGFEEVATSKDLALMRADLRGLLSLVDRVETAVRRMLRNEPTPSPAAWTRRGA